MSCKRIRAEGVTMKRYGRLNATAVIVMSYFCNKVISQC